MIGPELGRDRTDLCKTTKQIQEQFVLYNNICIIAYRHLLIDLLPALAATVAPM